MSRIQGSDSSKWDGLIDWSLAKEVINFNTSKASEGITYADPQFNNNKTNCFGNGVPFGAYHFFRPEYDPVLQARNFINVAGKDLNVYVCDAETPLLTQFQEARLQDKISSYSLETVEKQYRGLEFYTKELEAFMDSKIGSGGMNFSAESTSAGVYWSRVQAFLDEVERLTNKIPWIYTSPGFANGYLIPPISAIRYPLWIAHYFVPVPTIPYPWNTLANDKQYVLHQDTYKAQFPGFPPDCDRDYTNPSLEMDDVIRIFGNGGTNPPGPTFPFYVRVNTIYGLNIRTDSTNAGSVIAVTPYNTLLKVEGIEKDENGRERYKISGYVAGWLTRKV